MPHPRSIPSLLAAALCAATLAPRPGAAEPRVDFNRDVRPILSDTCFTCHGPDDAKRKAGLRLDLRDDAVRPAKSGKTAIVPGDAAASELIRRLVTADEDDRMPPAKGGKTISPEQVATLKRWVAQGAAYRGHWAFEPPVRPALPPVADAAWPRNEVDRFVLARLEAEGLAPAAEADRHTLVRRLSLDLTGLPPTPAEVDAFVDDPAPDAYEKVVDRLLASPRYGERMAMTWLDGARYADSHGYQADWERFQWRWRDWVIDAFNRNQPFDQFTIDQIAGDLRPGATTDQKVATGFHRNHRMNTEGGTIPEEWRTEYVIDRVDTTGTVWLGLTLGCARCHDHKYDPVSQKEFYQLFALFNNNAESGRGAEKAGNHEPVVAAPRPAEVARLAEFDRQIAAAQARAARSNAESDPKLAALQAEWERTAAGSLAVGAEWFALDPATVDSTSKVALVTQADKSILVSGPAAPADTYTVTFLPHRRKFSAIKVEALPDKSLPAGGPGRSANGNFVLTTVRLSAGGKDLKLVSASASFSQEKHPVAGAIDADPKDGWAIHPRAGQAHEAVFALDAPLELPAGGADPTLTLRLEFKSRFPQHTLGRFRVSATDSPAPHAGGGAPAAVVAALKVAPDRRSEQQRQALAAYFRAHHAGDAGGPDREVQTLRAARAAFEAALPTAMVMRELDKPREAHVLIRGEYDKPGAKVEMGLPGLFGDLPPGAPMNRLGLAMWMVKPDNPLTSRVAVNRYWEMFFGVGLVKTSENFGSQADFPSHPELLDWLATEFVRGGWDVKAIQRKIVTSAAYRQSAKVSAALVDRDPENRLIARGPRFRLQAEQVRDQALCVAGLLVEKLGGPSVRPYQPAGVWDEINVYGNLRNYKPDPGEGLYRRSMYTIWKRTAAPPAMTVFDMPNREVCQVKRSRTNTPLQALALMNDVTYLEASRVLAEKAYRAAPTPEARIAWAFRRATGREPTAAESKILAGGFERRLAKYRADVGAARQLVAQGDSKPDPTIDPAELAAYATTASVIMNLDEVVTRE